MMKRAPILHTYGDVTITCYYMDAGEEIPRHQHPWPHTTAVYAGRTRVDIFGPVLHSQCVMTVGDPDITLPPNIDHLITALGDGTIVVNATIGIVGPPPGPPAAAGGVMLADGCVVQP